jgi:preprotein translocase subunit SecG
MDQNILNILMIVEIVISVLIVISVILQNRAEGLGSMFGGGGEVFRTKRGLEKFLYYFTIVLGIVMCAISFVIVKYTK